MTPESSVTVLARDLHRLMPWADAIRQACDEKGENPYLLSAICLRETGAGWGAGYVPKGAPDGHGDNGHGFGLVQIDDRSHADFIARPDAKEPIEQFRYACDILRNDREWLRRHATLPPDDMERATVAAYNAGAGAVFHRIQAGEDVDRATTGGDYSRWVFDKCAALMLADPHLFAPVREFA